MSVLIQFPLLTSHQHTWEPTAVLVNLFPYLMMAGCLVEKYKQAFLMMTCKFNECEFKTSNGGRR